MGIVPSGLQSSICRSVIGDSHQRVQQSSEKADVVGLPLADPIGNRLVPPVAGIAGGASQTVQNDDERSRACRDCCCGPIQDELATNPLMLDVAVSSAAGPRA